MPSASRRSHRHYLVE